jgi:hypothetical protein
MDKKTERELRSKYEGMMRHKMVDELIIRDKLLEKYVTEEQPSLQVKKAIADGYYDPDEIAHIQEGIDQFCADNGLKITKANGQIIGHTKQQVEDIVNQSRKELIGKFSDERQRLEQVLNNYQRKLENAHMRFTIAYSVCLDAVMFADSPSWQNKMEVLRTTFDKAFNGIKDAYHHVEKERPKELQEMYGALYDESLNIAGSKALNQVLNIWIHMGSEMKDALTAAIQGDENLLVDIHKRRAEKDLLDALQDYSEMLDTSNIALDSKIKRVTLHLGIRALELQRFKGITAPEKQWRTIWRDLNGRSHTLTGDELMTWQYLKSQRVQERLTGLEIEDLNKKIDNYKQAAKSKFEAIYNLGQT